jgi:hypothetical protein
MTYIFKDELDVVGPELRAQWEIAPCVVKDMSHTAQRKSDHAALLATGLVVSLYLSAAMVFVQTVFC